MLRSNIIKAGAVVAFLSVLLLSRVALSYSPYVGKASPAEIEAAIRILVELREMGSLPSDEEPIFISNDCPSGLGFVQPGLRTHPWLAEQAINAFERRYPTIELTIEQKTNLIVGTVEEDISFATEDDCIDGLLEHARVIHHFYDGTGGLLTLAVAGQSVIEWATTSSLNAHRWKDAIEQGNTPAGWRSFGHILHLLEDMGVPAHTRNDSHLPRIDPDPLETMLGGLPYHQQGLVNLWKAKCTYVKFH